ncbi:MAG TPA: SDR family oxidoreductase [Propionibacteriaceae bacterium]|nr:SDR family oxidoreductase [Propionibacteriaceae bacterium]
MTPHEQATTTGTGPGELAGRIALVTGGARNVGRVIAKRLAADGALVIINHFRSPAEARHTQAEIEAAGGRAYVIRASVASPEQRDRMFDEIAETFGGLDILVNNAADGGLVPASEVTEKIFDRALDTNLKGSLGCSLRAAELMAGRAGAAIVNLSTLGGGQFVMANYLACGPAKAALEALTRYLAVEFAAKGIRVNTAAAGMIHSRVADAFPDAERMQRAVIQATPMGRLGEPEEFAEVVAFLASPRASWITGQVLLADGGLSTGYALLSPAPEPAAPQHGELEAAPSGPAVLDHPEPEQADTVPSPEALSAFNSVPVLDSAPVLDETVGGDGGAADADEIVVVGMGIAVPGASDPDTYWQELLHGADQFVKIPADRWDNTKFHSADKRDEDKSYSRHSGFIQDFVPHPQLADELADGTARPMDSTALWLRHSLFQAMEGVTLRPEDRCALLVGYTADGSQHLEEATVRSGVVTRMEPILAALDVPTQERDAWINRVDQSLERQYPRSGPDGLDFFPHQVGLRAMHGILPADTDLLLVDTACSSSLYAVDLGLKGLLEGRHDIAVCGGSFAVGPRGSVLFAKLNGLSTSGEVRSLDASSDGVLFSDGAGAVVLKRLSRARADGDRVLATLTSFGSSSDGKGKAIYAPSAAGQKLAISRAFDQPNAQGLHPDWVVAHATGTPAGDLAEFTTLRETVGTRGASLVTSNKSVIGHTGWAAGVASLIEVILAMHHQLIPPQHRYTDAPAGFALDSTPLAIPTAAVDWPAATGKRRVASVSGFGFGGTNAHLIVTDPPAQTARPSARPGSQVPPEGTTDRPRQQRIAVVAKAAHLPGEPDLDSWIAGNASSDLGFGTSYPLPPFQRVRMPPGTMRSIDRCQLMVLECAHQLRTTLGDFWESNRETAGVVIGHLGATRNATLYATRCYLDDLTAALHADPALADAEWLSEATRMLAEQVRGLVPPSTEDTFPGMMPNVIPARVANYFDLRGLNMTVDTGFTSTLSAVDVAARYLRQGDLSLALVGGINGNATAEVRSLLDSALPGDAQLAEGAFLLALTTEETARANGLEILGFVDNPVPALGSTSAQSSSTRVVCGARPEGRTTSYLGAEGAIGLLQALAGVAQGPDAVVVCLSESGIPDLEMVVSSAATVAAVSAPSDAERACDAATPPVVAEAEADRRPRTPDYFYDTSVAESGAALQVSRHVPVLVPSAGEAAADEYPFWPAAGTAVLTDHPELLIGLQLPAGTVVISTAPLPEEEISGREEAAAYLPQVTPEAVQDLLRERDPDGRVRHLRVISTLPASSGVDVPPSLLALHDLVFLVLQQRWATLGDTAEGTCLGLLLNGLANGAPHPTVGLFGGLFKVIQLELGSGAAFVLATSQTRMRDGLAEAEHECRLRRTLPVVSYQAGQRLVTELVPDPGELLAPDAPLLGRESVVVAVGGGRGITAELMTELARLYQSRLYILGSNRIEEHPREMLELSDEEFAGSRPRYILQQRSLHPDRTPADFNRAFQRIGDARATRSNLDRMAEHSGADRVRYLPCDVTDATQVAAALRTVRDEAGSIDLLVNAAGVNRSAPIASKSFAEFQRIRDLKVRGYASLKAATADQPPRVWCNFGSLLGMTGQLGEADYAAGNDFLGTAACASAASGATEITIGWTLWGEVGLGASELTKSYFEKSGLYSHMSTEEGVHHFVRELNQLRPAPYTVHLGAAERAAVDRLIPGFLDRPQPASAPVSGHPAEPASSMPQLQGFYLDRLVESGPDRMVFEHDFDLNSDDYLRHHLVDGVPTLPGTFVTEMACEAAAALVPELQPYALEDVVFDHFLKVYPGKRPLPKRIHARVVERRAPFEHAVVEIRVTGDVVAPNNTVLVKDRLHFSARVLLSHELPTAPSWKPWHPAAEQPVVDPYHQPGSPVLLTREFVSTTRTRLHPRGKRSTYNLALPPDHPVFGQFRVPVILLDGLLRTGVLAQTESGLIPLAAPVRIGRVDLYERINDAQVLGRRGEVELYAVTPEATPDARHPGAGNRFVAATSDGRMLLQLKNLDWTLIGYLDTTSGRFVSPAQAADQASPSAGPNHASPSAGQLPVHAIASERKSA